MVEAGKDVTITEEVVAANDEVPVDLEEEVLAVAEVSGQKKKAVSEVIEALLLGQNVQTDQEEKADSTVKAQLQKENRVLFKEKKEHQDDLQKVLTSQLVVHLMMQRQEDRGKAKAF